MLAMKGLPTNTVAAQVAKTLYFSPTVTNFRKAQGLVTSAMEDLLSGEVTLDLPSCGTMVRVRMPIPAHHFGTPEGDIDEFWDSEDRIPLVWNMLKRLVTDEKDPYYAGWDYEPDTETLILNVRY